VTGIYIVLAVLLLLENWSAGLNANLSFTNNKSRILRKGKKVYYSSDEEEDKESQPLRALGLHF
jgi:hypothetical protein